jgi:hypothetical protein
VFVLSVHPCIAQLDLSDPRFTVDKEMRANLILDALLKDGNEDIIVNGEVMVMDLTGFSSKHVARMTFDNNKDSYKIFQVGQLGTTLKKLCTGLPTLQDR